jgi:hypothetical protein
MAVYELAARRESSLIVRLLWDSIRNQTVIRYRDQLTGDTFEADVPNSCALVAFHHPQAYRPSRMVERSTREHWA